MRRRDGRVREFEYQVRALDGAILWLSDSATVVRNEAGEVIRYEGTVRDITDQKRAEDAIAEGRRLLQQVIDTVPAVINVKDKQLRYVLMNRYMAGIFGIDPADAIGRTTTDLMSRYGAQKTDENDKRVLAAGRGLGFYEEEYMDSSGNVRQWLVNKLPLLDCDGEIENIVTVALDIGERKRGELEMRKARDAAETALRDLRETQNSLIEAEKLAALGRLVAGVTHEVNNPVGISLTVASALERKTANFTAEVARGVLRRSSLNDFLETSRDASSQLVANLNRAAELIQSFKQVAADRNYSDQRNFDLGDLTEQVVMSLRPGLRKHNLTLNVDCQPNLIMNSYPGPYGQVLTNLFLNSVAHAFPDGKPGAVDIQVRESGKDNVEILFSDNGCGMSLDVRRRAFDPFFATRREERIECAPPDIEAHAAAIVGKEDFDVVLAGLPNLDIDGAGLAVRKGVRHRIEEQIGEHLAIGPGIGVHGQIGLAVDAERQMVLSQARSQAHHHLLGQVAEVEDALIRVVPVGGDLLERLNQFGRAIEIGYEL